MNLVSAVTSLAERAPLPDAITAFGVAQLVDRTSRQLSEDGPNAAAAFARDMARRPIAEFTAEANQQHYELPPRFFELVLGPRRKYSSCLYEAGAETLAEAELVALIATAEHGALADGQRILELGCGWGSLSLWMAERLPHASIVSVSNSAPQGDYIRTRAREQGLTNLRVLTADMNEFAPEGGFDRIVSVEMFEHVANWSALLRRARGWLEPDGRMFMHVFSHCGAPYRFDHDDPADWIARYFFTGGIMPSHDLIRHVAMPFEIEQEWRWNGTHYQRTALAWLANLDDHAEEIAHLMRGVYGTEAKVWLRRWRMFFLATAGLFGHAAGETWGISHYRLSPT